MRTTASRSPPFWGSSGRKLRSRQTEEKRTATATEGVYHTNFSTEKGGRRRAGGRVCGAAGANAQH